MPSVWTRISKHFQMCRITNISNSPQFYSSPATSLQIQKRRNELVQPIKSWTYRQSKEILCQEGRAATTLHFADQVSVIKQKN